MMEEKRKQGRPAAFPRRERYCIYCTPEEAKILRAALKRKHEREQTEKLQQTQSM